MARHGSTDREFIDAYTRVLPGVRPRAGGDPAELLRAHRHPGWWSLRRRKTRGWRRRMREFERWVHEEADQVPSEYRAADARIRFERWPWPLPLGVRRRMVEGLVRIHDLWLPRMREVTDRATYVGIWLTDGLYDSGTWASVGEIAEWHRQRHDPATADGRAERVAPPAEYHMRPCDLSRFEWTHWVTTWQDPLSTFDERLWRSAVRSAFRIDPIETAEGPDFMIHWVTHDWYGWIRPEDDR